MASLRKEILVEARSQDAWDAVRDFSAVHRRLAAGFVVDARMDGDDRIVTFANGMVAREALVDIDDQSRRLVYTASGARLTHHNGSVQVSAEGERRCRIVWVIDMLPNELADSISGMMDQGAVAIKRTLEQAS